MAWMPQETFSEFYNHPFIKSIADKPKWTVSDLNKRPIDLRRFFDDRKIYGPQYERVHGAKFTDERSLVTLTELCSELPNASNHAFWLDALEDNFVVLDIEPKCPYDLKMELLKLPYIYGEVSMSGQGYHLIFSLPDYIDKYPIAKKKVTLKEEHGYYEILLNHYVTFTRKTLKASDGDGNFDEIFQNLAKKSVDVTKNDISVSLEKPEIPHEEEILTHLNAQEYKKKPSDFYNDLSKYEYGYIGFLWYKLYAIAHVSKFKDHEYTDSEYVWLLYESAKTLIPYRAKHEEKRSNMPWLMYLASELLAKNPNPTKRK